MSSLVGDWFNLFGHEIAKKELSMNQNVQMQGSTDCHLPEMNNSNWSKGGRHQGILQLKSPSMLFTPGSRYHDNVVSPK